MVTTTSSLAALVVTAPRLHGWALVLAAFAYTMLFQTAFALFHEASHLKLHPDPRWNRVLGQVVGLVFGMSTTMFGITHWSHHLKNRSVEEAFEQVAPGERRWVKAIGWYGMLLSLWYWVIPLANALVLVAPDLAARLARRARIADRVFDAPPATRRAIRLELALWVVAVAGALWVGGLHALLLHAVAAWWWSSSNYAEHAYASRDVVEGAFNLRAPRWYGWVNLHRELDLTHHRWPDASWIELPVLTTEHHASLGRAWLGQWRGPVPGERGPEPVDELPT